MTFFVLHEFLHFDKFGGADCKYDKCFSKLQPQNAPNKVFLAPKFFELNGTLDFEKLQGSGLKYDNSFLKI